MSFTINLVFHNFNKYFHISPVFLPFFKLRWINIFGNILHHSRVQQPAPDLLAEVVCTMLFYCSKFVLENPGKICKTYQTEP